MKQIVEERDDIVFYIKMLPLKSHPDAYRKSKAIVCEKSLWLLERAFDGKTIREPSCNTTEVDDNIELARRLGITGTPAVVLPDGGISPGFKDAATLIGLIEEASENVRAMEQRLREYTGGVPSGASAAEEEMSDTGYPVEEEESAEPEEVYQYESGAEGPDDEDAPQYGESLSEPPVLSQ